MVLPQLEPDSDAETARESSIDSTTTTVTLKPEETQPPAEPEAAPTEENHRVDDPGAGGDQTPGKCFFFSAPAHTKSHSNLC